MPRILLKERCAFGNADTGGAWLSSACAIRCVSLYLTNYLILRKLIKHRFLAIPPSPQNKRGDLVVLEREKIRAGPGRAGSVDRLPGTASF
ncbi:hypothetical protein CRG98_010179 [Punica granatum]|uniref:Uncharacterized protein n=1 Tax=Punica granatum TaxID=22663 RepID=A0A2I0KLJ4_PUNGR|nr:hypothetical protein CRG98_010179 [Punica granatum]